MMISLPSKWVRANNLEKGSEVDLEEKNNELVIGTDEIKKVKKEKEVNLGPLTESSIRTIITNTYRLGYDKIKLNYKDKEIARIIGDVIKHNLIGFEIIKKTSEFCIIENITEPSKEQFESIFSKVFLNIEELFEVSEAMLSGRKEYFRETELNIQKFDNFCRRIIAKYNLLEEYGLRWMFHSELIHAQRELYHMLCYLEKKNEKVSKDVFNLLNESKKMFEMLKKAYNEKSITDLEDIHSLEKELIYKNGYELLKKGKNNIVIHHIINSIRFFYLASSPLIGINL